VFNLLLLKGSSKRGSPPCCPVWKFITALSFIYIFYYCIIIYLHLHVLISEQIKIKIKIKIKKVSTNVS